jgi:2-phosphoglycerate kinase
VLAAALISPAGAFSGIMSRSFLQSPKVDDKPKLILIAGPPGTGKSTFGMSVALDQGILKCISTDTIRAVMRSFVAEEISPALHRSSYAPSGHKGDDPVRSWRETCTVLDHSIQGLVDDALSRGVSLVVEGVHVVPSCRLIQRWEDCGGVAIGVLLTVTDEENHKSLLRRRGFITGNVDAEEKKMKSMERVRLIQDEMIRLAKECGWLQIEQKLEPDPLEVVATKLWNIASGIEKPCKRVDVTISDKECSVPPVTVEEFHLNETTEVEL